MPPSAFAHAQNFKKGGVELGVVVVKGARQIKHMIMVMCDCICVCVFNNNNNNNGDLYSALTAIGRVHCTIAAYRTKTLIKRDSITWPTKYVTILYVCVCVYEIICKAKSTACIEYFVSLIM